MITALILIDIQNDYFPGGKMELAGSMEASLNAQKILEKFRLENKLIVHIQHFSQREGATFFLPDTDGVEIRETAKPRENEKVIVKHFPNSFRDTALLPYLKDNEVSNLVIAGMMTHMCVDATTRTAKDLGFNCIVIGDACATKDLEWSGSRVKATEVQTAFLSALNYFYSTVMTTEQYLSMDFIDY